MPHLEILCRKFAKQPRRYLGCGNVCPVPIATRESKERRKPHSSDRFRPADSCFFSSSATEHGFAWHVLSDAVSERSVSHIAAVIRAARVAFDDWWHRSACC